MGARRWVGRVDEVVGETVAGDRLRGVADGEGAVDGTGASE